jgi:hypothetical protein
MDLRDIVEGDKIGSKDSLDKFLVKVDPIKAVQDQDYFFKVIFYWVNVRPLKNVRKPDRMR